MDETIQGRVDELLSEKRGWELLLEQTLGAHTAYEEGWCTTEAYAEVGRLRDRCREEIWGIESQIAEIEGEEPPDRPEKASPPTPERMGDAEDAMADLSEVASAVTITAADNADAIADLSEIVSSLVGGDV